MATLLATLSAPAGLLTTPSTLLASTCRFLQVVDLLRLLRSCSTLRRLNTTDASFYAVAWSAAHFHLELNKPRDEWLLPAAGWVVDENTRVRHIPLSLWQQAVPVCEYSMAQWERLDVLNVRNQLGPTNRALLEAALRADQPTTVIRTAGGKDCVVLDAACHRRYDMRLGQIPCFRVRFVLRATPHLQHLHLTVDVSVTELPGLSDSFLLVPRLRSLLLEQVQRRITDLSQERAIVPICDMLALLPSLTALHCVEICVGTQDLIDIAAHTTLEHILVQTRKVPAGERRWLRHGVFYSATWDDSGGDEQDDTEGDSEDVEEEQTAAEARRNAAAIQRLLSALTRVAPTHHSIQARVAFADYLQRRMRKKNHRIYVRPPLLLRQQLDTLRATLRQQLEASAPADEEGDESEQKRGTKRARTDEAAVESIAIPCRRHEDGSV